MSEFINLVADRVIPVVVLDNAREASPLADALVEGGINVAEVTFRTSAAFDAIKEMSHVNSLVVGAGTVVSPGQVDLAAEAGARFIVSPGLLPAVVQRAAEHGLPVVPGAVTPSELMLATELGLDLVKFFPASTFGGPSAIKALGAPFGQLSFIPTGGVSLENLGDYLSLPNVPAVGGSWMVKQSLVNAGEFTKITDLARGAVAAAAAIKGGVGA
ncbi:MULTISPECIES: bifunctional 4-hydroxy-2-oxoglutarate aldolase/2-dehydro-3-deoxy-phosphogluconate aldolase [unclassified Luteococcus]|uniref:bifunctional 4-hydroxy-2-oxoglutarate aldolase/2-dehydro-3-deoxy-phosphogluconate aldolase n=1 Tax=unclassified Luteococcus TaxID=2639923 RepID=UPI00313F3B81